MPNRPHSAPEEVAAAPVDTWPCVRAAQAREPAARIGFCIADVPVGSVAREHVDRVKALASPGTLAHQPAGDGLAERLVWCTPAPQRDAELARLNAALRDAGVLVGWRDEPFAVVAQAQADSARACTAAPLAVIERAAARFWGTLTFGAHANGHLADAAGRPTHLWLGRRALSKATDPGRLDNLVGGGVPWRQSPAEALLREAWEEAGLPPDLAQQARPVRVLRLHRDLPEGLQHEHLHAFDLRLPPDWRPQNQDGEVAGFDCLPMDAALAQAASGAMTVDAALVTLDFALRHRLLPAAEHARLAQALRPLVVA
ncbi:MAG: NUDIX domain-containing protein [Leptothrix sp. (in: b-proteobacteria)]